MRAFLGKLAAFVVLQGAVGAVVLANYRIDRQSFLASVIDKHRRLEETAAPRVLLVGGSNVAFGTDSEMIKQSLDREPVNLAIQASLGLNYMLQEAEARALPGDAIVLSLEYEQFVRRTEEVLTLMRLAEQDPNVVADLEWDWPLVKMLLDEGHLCLREALVRSVARLRTGKTPEARHPYRRDAFNQYGDVVAHHNLSRLESAVDSGHLSLGRSFDEALLETIERLNRFQEQCQQRGVTAFLFLPAIPQHCYAEDALSIGRIMSALTQDCTIPLLNKPEEMVYPETEFFDTVYHLTAEGTRRRTRLLIERLGAQQFEVASLPLTSGPNARVTQIDPPTTRP